MFIERHKIVQTVDMHVASLMCVTTKFDEPSSQRISGMFVLHFLSKFFLLCQHSLQYLAGAS